MVSLYVNSGLYACAAVEGLINNEAQCKKRKGQQIKQQRKQHYSNHKMSRKYLKGIFLWWS